MDKQNNVQINVLENAKKAFSDSYNLMQSLNKKSASHEGDEDKIAIPQELYSHIPTLNLALQILNDENDKNLETVFHRADYENLISSARDIVEGMLNSFKKDTHQTYHGKSIRNNLPENVYKDLSLQNGVRPIEIEDCERVISATLRKIKQDLK